MGTELHNLKAPEGARKKKKRIGRGPGSGNGKTAGRGSKGQKKRSTVRVGFEGGQNPIHRRVPKRGFVNNNRVEVHGVNVARLSAAFDAGSEVTVEELLARGLGDREVVDDREHGRLVRVVRHDEQRGHTLSLGPVDFEVNACRA